MERKNAGSTGYPEYGQMNLPSIEKQILAWWKENKIFERSVSERSEDNPFVFYEGPPSANGKPGIHHVMSRTIKDMFCRYKTLQGFRVERKAGWDTHGLPVELNVEKQLGITKADIGTKITIAEYNRLCREDVMRFTDVWNDMTEKMGYWVDMSDPYITYENNYIESLWSILKKLYDKGLLYEGYTIQPYSPAAGTGLSSHELNQPGCYRNVKDVTAVAQFKISPTQTLPQGEGFLKVLNDLGLADNTYFLAWTTTPWTLPSNTALAVGAGIEYVVVKTYNPYTFKPLNLVLAKDLFGKYFSAENANLKLEDYKPGDKAIPYSIVHSAKGRELEGIRYEQLLPYTQPTDGDAFRVLVGDFVTTTDGTGIVHIAPSFGSDDFRVAKQNGIGSLTLVDRQGKFVEEVNDEVFPLEGRYVKEAYLTDAEKEQEFHLQKEILRVNNIIADLKSYMTADDLIVLKLKLENKLFKTEKYEHNYPHCWRTDKPVIYYPLDSWFIKTTAVKDRLIELNKTINWKPAHTGEGRFGQWLENLVDWNLSRSRYWGTPLPMWRDNKTHRIHVVGRKEDLLGGTITSLQGLSVNKDSHEISERKLDATPIKVEGYILTQKFKEFAASLPKEGRIEIEGINDATTPWTSESIISQLKTTGYSYESILRVLPKSKLESLLQKVSLTDIQEIDFHKPAVDEIVFINFEGVIGLGIDRIVLTRVPDLIDVWFDSGAMPYAQWHYPFENEEKFRGSFPADFIAEGVDQTRGWFFTLHVLAVMLFDSVAYKNVVSNGLLLDKKGEKMSKRLGNVVDPFEAIEKYSADATRWYMMRNSDPWENLKFDVNGLQDTMRSHYGTLYNTYAFFALYANLDKFVIDEMNIVPLSERTELDRWILSKLQTLVAYVTERMNDYDVTPAARAIEAFVDEHLSNWYVRLSRRRFWKGEMSRDKQAAYETLYECLNVVTQLMSPVSPFFSEWMYKNLTDVVRDKAKASNTPLQHDSVHLTYLTTPDTKYIDKDLEERMELAQKACSLIFSLRKKEKIKVRQPLGKVLIPVLSNKMKEQLQNVESYILGEVNVKEIEYIDDASGIIKKKIKPNFKELGKRAGTKMKAVQNAVNAFITDDIAKIEAEQKYVLNLDSGDTFEITLADVEILSEDIPGWLVASDAGLTVALDVTITDELRKEGNAREFVNKVQNLRKDKDFQVLDRIKVSVVKNPTFEEALNSFKDYICNEVLAKEIVLVESLAEFDEVEMNEDMLQVKVELN